MQDLQDHLPLHLVWLQMICTGCYTRKNAPLVVRRQDTFTWKAPICLTLHCIKQSARVGSRNGFHRPCELDKGRCSSQIPRTILTGRVGRGKSFGVYMYRTVYESQCFAWPFVRVVAPSRAASSNCTPCNTGIGKNTSTYLSKGAMFCYDTDTVTQSLRRSQNFNGSSASIVYIAAPSSAPTRLPTEAHDPSSATTAPNTRVVHPIQSQTAALARALHAYSEIWRNAWATNSYSKYKLLRS